jgi:D-alanine-D-alanine ligase
MRSLRVLLIQHGYLIAPGPDDRLSCAEREYAVLAGDVERALGHRGHTVRRLGVDDDLLPVRHVVEDWEPHVVFNLLPSFRGDPRLDMHVAAYLELLDVPYTGCDAGGIERAQSKPLAKTLFAHHGIPTPRFVVVRRGLTPRGASKLRYPVIVKPVAGLGSLWVSQASVVRTPERLRHRVHWLHRRADADALVEEFVPGREIAVGVMGNRRLVTFPPWETFFRKPARASLSIQTERAKWDPRYQRRRGIITGKARLPPRVARDASRIGKRVYRCLGLSGCARVDLRLRSDGQLFVLEANTPPHLGRRDKFARAARAAGMSYPDLLERLVLLALRRMERG